MLDNTWASPLLFPAIAAGVDISILALSKYVGGHSDVMLGSATANAEHFPRVQKTCWDLGHAVSPDDAWLGSRGLRTLGVRLKQHEAECACCRALAEGAAAGRARASPCPARLPRP